MKDTVTAKDEREFDGNLNIAQTILNSIAVLDNVSKAEDMRGAISDLLEIISRNTGAERVYIFDKLDDMSDIYTNSYEWCADGVVPQIDNLSNIQTSDMPYWINEFEHGNTIIIGNIEEISDTMPSEYEILKAQDIRSEISVPIFYKEHLSGFIGLDNPSGQSELLIKLLSLVGTHIGTARANLRMLTLLRENQEELEKI